MVSNSDLEGGVPTDGSTVSLGSLVVAAADEVEREPTKTDLTNNRNPTEGRVGVATNSDTVYIGDGSSWVNVNTAIAADADVASDIVGLTPQDVTDISSPSRGDVAYHDGSGGNTEGVANYNGTSWVSVVDGTTIS